MNSMTVRELIVDGSVHVLDDRPLPERFHEIAEFGVLASPVDPFDPMDRAFRSSASSTSPTRSTCTRTGSWSGSTRCRRSCWRSRTCGARRTRAGYVVAAKGAPEAIADLCHLDPAERAALTRAGRDGDGERAAGPRRRPGAVRQADGLPAEQHDFDFDCLGLAGLHDPVRPGVADAVAECARAGVRVVMITGDYPGTALAIAREIGLDHAAGCITGPELEAMSDDELARRIRTVNVFARMVPEQKLRLDPRAQGQRRGRRHDRRRRERRAGACAPTSASRWVHAAPTSRASRPRS